MRFRISRLRNQDGRSIALHQFRGKELLITFIYTRCPLPNFCPLVTHNFAVIDEELAPIRRCISKTHLLCVSFDPEHDTPERLRAYGADLHRQRCEECLCPLGFCGARREDRADRDGEVL